MFRCLGSGVSGESRPRPVIEGKGKDPTSPLPKEDRVRNPRVGLVRVTEKDGCVSTYPRNSLRGVYRKPHSVVGKGGPGLISSTVGVSVSHPRSTRLGPVHPSTELPSVLRFYTHVRGE